MPWQALVVDDWLGLRADGRWAARDCGLAVARQNGKSLVAELRILAGLFLLREQLIVYSAHQVDTALQIFERIIHRIEMNPALKRRMVGRPRRARGSERILLRDPHQELLIKARSKEGLRGFSADVIFYDEAQMGLDEVSLAASGPTQRARPNPQSLFMGTPPLEPGSYWATNLRARSVAGDPRLCWHEWAPPEAYNPADPAVWRLTNPAYGILIDDEAIEQDLKTLGSRFPAEGLGAWPVESGDASWDVFGRAAWAAAEDPESRSIDPRAFAIEVSLDRKQSVVAVAGRREDGLRHVELAVIESGTEWVVDWMARRAWIWHPCAIVVAANGPAGSLIPDLEAAGLTIEKVSTTDYSAACGALFDGIAGEVPEDADPARVRDLRHLGQGPLTTAAASARRLWLGRKTWMWDHERQGHLLAAATLALWGHAKFAPAWTGNYNPMQIY